MTGKRGETENELTPHPRVVVEHWEGYLSCGGSSGGSRGPSPTPGPPSPGFQCWEEDSQQNLAMKISRNSGHSGETEGCWKPKHPFKGLCTDSLISRHLSWPLVEGLKLRTYQNIQEKIESGEGWSDSHHCPFVESSFYAAYGRAPSFLCWAYSCHSYIWICISLVRSPHSTLVTSWHLTPPNLHIVGGASMAGHPAPPQALSRRFLQQASALTQPESLLVAVN